MNIGKEVRHTGRVLVLFKRDITKPSDRPTCPYPKCPYYKSSKWVQRIQADEFGKRVTGQFVCDYFSEGKPPGCGNSFVWLKEDIKKLKDTHEQQRSFPVSESRHQSSWPIGWRKPEWEEQQ